MDLGFANPNPIQQPHFKIQSKSKKLTVSKSKPSLILKEQRIIHKKVYKTIVL